MKLLRRHTAYQRKAILCYVIFSIAKGVQHDLRLPFWKPASVFAHYVRIIIVLLLAK